MNVLSNKMIHVILAPVFLKKIVYSIREEETKTFPIIITFSLALNSFALIIKYLRKKLKALIVFKVLYFIYAILTTSLKKLRVCFN